jgi:hypothetical protein
MTVTTDERPVRVNSLVLCVSMYAITAFACWTGPRFLIRFARLEGVAVQGLPSYVEVLLYLLFGLSSLGFPGAVFSFARTRSAASPFFDLCLEVVKIGTLVTLGILIGIKAGLGADYMYAGPG